MQTKLISIINRAKEYLNEQHQVLFLFNTRLAPWIAVRSPAWDNGSKPVVTCYKIGGIICNSVMLSIEQWQFDLIQQALPSGFSDREYVSYQTNVDVVQ